MMLNFERRGWIYWRIRPPGSSSPGRAILTEFQQLVEPEIRHVQEHDRQQRAFMDDESDDDRCTAAIDFPNICLALAANPPKTVDRPRPRPETVGQTLTETGGT